MNTIRLSKFLSLILRHNPEKIDLTLDQQGWTEVSHLLERLAANGKPTTREQLNEVVETNDKKRFAFSEGGTKIRANQGHSIEIDLGLSPTIPPEILHHGTASRLYDAICQEGLKPGNRQHVHLSEEKETAIKVGSRHGKPIIFRVKSGEMHRNGHPFYCSENGVWLTDTVPATYLEIPNPPKIHAPSQ